MPLHVVGGGFKALSRLSWRGVRWRGMLGGEEKLAAISGARGLLFPVLWHEPFGIAVVEAMALGAPVVATPFGSLPELVTSDVGTIAHSESELIRGVHSCAHISPEACRQWVESRFTHGHMAEAYLRLYTKITQQGPLHPGPLVVSKNQGELLDLPVNFFSKREYFEFFDSDAVSGLAEDLALRDGPGVQMQAHGRLGGGILDGECHPILSSMYTCLPRPVPLLLLGE